MCASLSIARWIPSHVFGRYRSVASESASRSQNAAQ